MKKTLSVLAVVFALGFAPNSYADYAGDAQSFRSGMLQDLKQLEVDRISISNENIQIDAIKGTYETAVRVHNEKNAILTPDINAYNAEAAQHRAQVNDHNARPCIRYRPGDCSAYQAEAEQQNAWKDRLMSRKAELESRSNNLEWSRQQLDNQKSKITEMVNAYNKKREEWITRKENVIAKLAEYKQITDNCIKIIKDGRSDEAIRLGCGVLFDGSDPNLPTLESLGVKPGEKGWPGMKMTPNK